MTYAKPEVNLLGDAARVIQDTRIKGDPIDLETTDLRVFNPAYDLDE